MKVFLLTNSYLPQLGGLEIAVYNIAHQLSQKGHRVTVVSGTSAISYSKKMEEGGICVYRMPFILPRIVLRCGYKRAVLSLLKSIISPLIIPLTLIKLGLIIKSIKPDIVNLHYIAENAFFYLVVRKFLKSKFIVNIHGSDIDRCLQRSFFARWLTRITLKEADYVLSNSDYLLCQAKKICPEVAVKSRRVENGIDLKRFDNFDKYKNNSKYILSIGNISFNKGFDILIKAFNRVHFKCPDLNLLIVGEGSGKTKCEKIVSEFGIGDSVKFLGKIKHSKIPMFLRGCEIFVLPSRKEAFGIVLLEAMAVAKSIVATRVGGVPEVVKEGENAILVEPDSPEDLASGIINVLENPDLAERFGKKSKEIVKEFTWDKIVDKYIDVYKSLVKV